MLGGGAIFPNGVASGNIAMLRSEGGSAGSCGGEGGATEKDGARSDFGPEVGGA